MLGKHSTAAALDPRSLITHSCQRTLGSEKFIDTNLSCGLEIFSVLRLLSAARPALEKEQASVVTGKNFQAPEQNLVQKEVP